MKKAVWAFAALLSLQNIALAGVKLRMEGSSVEKGGVQVGWVYVGDKDRLRIDSMENGEEAEPLESMIFRADLGAMLIIDHDAKEYLVMNQERLQMLAAKMEDAAREMEKQLENMPEDQRKMMEQILKKNLPQVESDQKMTVREAGLDGELRKYEVWMGDSRKSEVWVDSPSRLGITPDIILAFRQMSDFYQKILEAVASKAFVQGLSENPFSGFAEMDGFPVRILDLENGWETRMSEVSTVELEDGFFDPPAGYSERQAGF